jgi:hypothetical protein
MNLGDAQHGASREAPNAMAPINYGSHAFNNNNNSTTNRNSRNLVNLPRTATQHILFLSGKCGWEWLRQELFVSDTKD